jgi:hypothetical protein
MRIPVKTNHAFQSKSDQALSSNTNQRFRCGLGYRFQLATDTAGRIFEISLGLTLSRSLYLDRTMDIIYTA